MNHYLVNARTRHRQSAVAVMLGVMLGLSLALSYWLIKQIPEARAREGVDFRMEVSCAMPRNEGEMTVVTVHGGKLICWRWK